MNPLRSLKIDWNSTEMTTRLCSMRRHAIQKNIDNYLNICKIGQGRHFLCGDAHRPIYPTGLGKNSSRLCATRLQASSCIYTLWLVYTWTTTRTNSRSSITTVLFLTIIQDRCKNAPLTGEMLKSDPSFDRVDNQRSDRHIGWSAWTYFKQPFTRFHW